ncbi:hypothetical protein SAMN05444266_105177 [Chitinophaga jiangningensis]|uniref:EF-hand domain-containing protein n=1 Tax=Chitinophaga jiangningensis TaxID=1419482 RepID=A0A1M7DWY2_9BACT|nr:hypothetical protein [Chitinophaga jiangningensis]SHL84021.1 hypothetical protein SAMN05444266_105177 [Chitinophaga jiangningensis]
MFEQLLQLVQEHAQTAVVNNPAVPNEQNQAVVQAATESITSSLQQELANGNTAGVLSLLGGQSDTNANPLVNNISNNFLDTLLKKFNLDKGAATQIAGSLIPAVLGSLVNKTNDPSNKGFSLDGILGSLTGGASSGLDLNGILGKLKGGLDKDGDGDVDFNDLKNVLSNGAKQQQGGNSGAGFGDVLKNLFG